MSENNRKKSKGNREDDVVKILLYGFCARGDYDEYKEAPPYYKNIENEGDRIDHINKPQ